MGNGAKVVVLAIGVYSLTLPTGLMLELENCYYVPTISRNIILYPIWIRKVFVLL